MRGLKEALCKRDSKVVLAYPDRVEDPLRLLRAESREAHHATCAVCRATIRQVLREIVLAVAREYQGEGHTRITSKELRSRASLLFGRTVHPRDVAAVIRPVRLKVIRFKGEGSHRGLYLTELMRSLDSQ